MTACAPSTPSTAAAAFALGTQTLSWKNSTTGGPHDKHPLLYGEKDPQKQPNSHLQPNEQCGREPWATIVNFMTEGPVAFIIHI